jgi:RNA polymerase sigma-70 factor (ECF subfamily)
MGYQLVVPWVRAWYILRVKMPFAAFGKARFPIVDDLGSQRTARGSAGARNAQSSPGFDESWPPGTGFDRTLEYARQFDEQAITLLYSRFMPVVYRYVLARIGDIHHAEDVTSETFFAAIERIATTRAQDELGFVSWLLGIARNKVALHFRKKHARPEQPLIPEVHDLPADASGMDDPLAIITARESWEEVVAALNQLTEEQRTVLLYRCVLGYSAEDVAKLMHKQAGAVRALQFRALGSLARLLGISPRPSQPERRRRS